DFGFSEFATIAHALVFSFAVVAGTFFEALGSKFEVKWDDEREFEYQVKENWYVYLSRVLEREPVGYRYLSRLATTMYFELAMMSAVPIFAVGTVALALARLPEQLWTLVLTGAVLAIVSGSYFFRQARSTHQVLCI